MLLANPISADLDAMRPSVLPLADRGGFAQRGARPHPRPSLSRSGRPSRAAATPTSRRSRGLRAGQGAAMVRRAVRAGCLRGKSRRAGADRGAGRPAANLTVVADAPGWYHPGRSGQMKLGPKTVIARFGELHPSVMEAMDLKGPAAAFEVFVDAIPLPKAKATKTKPALVLSDYQAVERDFAFVVNASVAAADLIRAAAGADKAHDRARRSLRRL